MNLELYPEETAILSMFNPNERRISVFSDNQTGFENPKSIAQSIAAKILFLGFVDSGAERLAAYAAGDIVLVDVSCNESATLDIFLDQLNAIASADQIPVLVNSTPECLDRVAARLCAPSVALLCQADMAEWLATLAMFGVVGAPVLHDVIVDDSVRLQRLADEVQRIARTLTDLVGNAPPPLHGVSDALIGFRAQPTGHGAPQSAVTMADVRAIIRLRRMRDRFFRSDLFADPAWDMLLDLMAARLERMQVAVSSLCIAAAVPPTTALRWIKTMTENGMFVRVADPEDGRRVFIELSDGAASGMAAYLSAAKASGGLAI
jgi:DNA-binding MarR family transcriptional regulator